SATATGRPVASRRRGCAASPAGASSGPTSPSSRDPTARVGERPFTLACSAVHTVETDDPYGRPAMGRGRERVSTAERGSISRARGAPSQGDRAYRELKTRLLVGDFPPNVRLAEERLAAMLDVSRTPVREALKRLQAEGLVAVHRDGGHRP